MKMGYYKANIVNGVYFYDTLLGEPKTDVLKAEDFLEALPDLEDGEEITGRFFGPDDEDIFNEIVMTYGVH